MPAVTACAVSSGRSISVSSAITARRWTSNGLKPAPKSRATSARRGGVEQREHLVILAPQLAQPLHRQRLGRDDQAALDLLRVQQPVHDQRGFDRLAQPDFVGQQPPHRHPRGRAFGDVQLMREQPDAPAEERAEAARLARREQVQDVEPRQEVFGVVDCRPLPAARAATGRDSPCTGRLLRLGTSASLVAASRSVAPVCGKWTTRTRPSIAVTRPVPSSGLKRWVRWSPTDQACTSADLTGSAVHAFYWDLTFR